MNTYLETLRTLVANTSTQQIEITHALDMYAWSLPSKDRKRVLAAYDEMREVYDDVRVAITHLLAKEK